MSSRRTAGTRARDGALTVLVADDSAVMRAMIIRTLRLSGVPIARVHEAGDGEVGLRALRDQPIELALVDVNMPKLDGMTMLEQARAMDDAHRPAVVVVTSDGSDACAAAVLGAGGVFLHKPFTPEALRDAVRRALGEVADA